MDDNINYAILLMVDNEPSITVRKTKEEAVKQFNMLVDRSIENEDDPVEYLLELRKMGEFFPEDQFCGDHNQIWLIPISNS
jgi:hypothetical protein